MKRRYWILAALLLALLSGPACAIGGFLEQVGLGADDPGMLTDAPAPLVPTLYPTVTPTPSPASPTQPPAAPSADDRDFILEMTESDLKELIGDQPLGEQGLRIYDMEMRITEQNVIGTFNASHADMGLSGELRAVGVPQVVDGKLYLRIVDHSLGDGFSGFQRMIANAVIRSAIGRINTAHGIPILLGGVAEITSVELQPGLLVIYGRLD